MPSNDATCSVSHVMTRIVDEQYFLGRGCGISERNVAADLPLAALPKEVLMRSSVGASHPELLVKRRPSLLFGSDQMLSVFHVARALGLSPRTVRYLASLGELPASKIGRTWRFRVSEILAYIEKQRGENLLG
jgi:excisionase family DNA binding protein